MKNLRVSSLLGLILILFNSYNLFAQEFSNIYSSSTIVQYTSLVLNTQNSNEVIVLGSKIENATTQNKDLLISKMSLTGVLSNSYIFENAGKDDIPVQIISSMNGGYIILSSTNSYDASDIMVTKIDNQLNFISNTVYKQTTLGYDRPSGIFESTNGEILISSVNQSTLSNVNSMRINFLKIASNGSVVWSKYYSGYSAFYSGGIIQHSSGDIYISGGVKIDSTSSSTTRNNQPILLKISNSGVLLNARLYRGSIVSDVTKNNGFRGLKELSNGTIALVGGSKTFTNQPSPQTRQDGFYLCESKFVYKCI